MKRKGTFILSLLVSLVLLASCSSKNSSALLCVTGSSWPTTSQAESTTTYTVKKGDTIELGGMSDLTITIVSVSEKKVVFTTNTPMSDHDDGTIDLNTNKTEFELNTEETLSLMTPTMDAGDIYRFELQQIKK